MALDGMLLNILDMMFKETLPYALKYQSGFANGGNNMFNVGEYVGQASEVDYYTSQLIKIWNAS